jgi:hypothetical protein
MKKIIYISTKPLENWEFFIPPGPEETDQDNLSLLVLHKEQDLKNVPISQVWYLEENQKKPDNGSSLHQLSYQGFLEQIFSHDLPVVI